MPFENIPKDLTYGRASLPFSPSEVVVRSDPHAFTEHTIPFPFKGAKDRFIYYQTWSLPTVHQRKTDIVWVHGLNDYGGRFSQNCLPILQQGFRVIAIDMPGCGRSSGLHSCIEDWEELTESVRQVITHVKQQNVSDGDGHRKTILSGGSMGGFVTISYSIKYPDDVDAFHVFCPLVYVADSSRPSKLVEWLARIIVSTPLGTLPLTPADRGKGSSDPKVEEAFMSDPQTYHGNLRACTGLALLDGITWLHPNLNQVNKPFLAQHGLSDRVCQATSSKDLFSRAQTPDDQKKLYLYENCEHDMLREPCADQVLQDLVAWLVYINENQTE